MVGEPRETFHLDVQVPRCDPLRSIKSRFSRSASRQQVSREGDRSKHIYKHIRGLDIPVRGLRYIIIRQEKNAMVESLASLTSEMGR